MNPYWENLSDRFNAMSQRERVLVGGGVVGVIIYMIYFLMIDPLIVAKPKLARAIQQDRAMVKTLEAALSRNPERTEADAVKQSYQLALENQLAELKVKMDAAQKGLVPPDQMAKLLEGMIGNSRGIELITLRKLPVERLETGKGNKKAAQGSPTPAAKAASEPKAVPGRGIYQHGFELKISGSYTALYDYLARLEKLPWKMFWSKVSLDATQHPRLTLTLVVHTLNMDKTWLTL